MFLSSIQGYEGERNTDPKIAQAKQGLDRNANKKKKKKKMVAEEGPSKQNKYCTYMIDI